MAYESLFFVALTAGYFISLFFHERIVNWEPFRFGIYTYYVLIVLIMAATVARSISVDKHDPTAMMQIDIWFGGLTWLAAGSSTVFLLASLMPKLRNGNARRAAAMHIKHGSSERDASFDPFAEDDATREDDSSETK